MVRAKQKKIIFSIVVSAALVALVIVAMPAKNSSLSSDIKRQNPSAITTNHQQTSSFDKKLYSVDEASSLWVVVNKGRILPSNYAPLDLVTPNVLLRQTSTSPEMHIRSEASRSLELMFAAANKDNIHLMLGSGYRSYANQVATYNGFAKADGVAKADTYSARPGHSEHQTGWAADIEPTSQKCQFEQCFENTPEGRWLAANCYSYGFIIRYQKTTQSLTGYEYEPWHIRYVGIALAAQIKQSGQTLEQYFGLPAYSAYPTNSYAIKNL